MKAESFIVVSVAGLTPKSEIAREFRKWAVGVSPEARVTESKTGNVEIQVADGSLPKFLASLRDRSAPPPPFFSASFPLGLVELRDSVVTGEQYSDYLAAQKELRPLTATPRDRSDLLSADGKYDWRKNKLPILDD